MEKTVHNELRAISHLIFRVIENQPTEKRLDSMTGTNRCIIGYLAHHKDTDVFQRDLEKEFGITRSTASKVINLMERKEFVERQSVPYDARLKKIVMTEKSKAISHDMHDEMKRFEGILTDGFSDEEIKSFYSYIDRMKKNLKNYNLLKEKEDD